MTVTDMAGRRPKPTPRTPPHDLAAERALLGAIILSRKALQQVNGQIQPDDFYQPAHSHIYHACTQLETQGQPVDAVTITNHLTTLGLLEQAGGLQTITDLTIDTPSTTNAETYAHLITQKALLRRLIAAAGEIAEHAYNNQPDAADLAEQAIYYVTATQTRVGRTETAADALTRAIDQLEHAWEHGGAHGTPTGFTDLDQLLLGLHPGQLITIAARPGMGKTALGSQIGVNAARAGTPTLFVSVEMSIDELVQRVISSEGTIDMQRLRAARLAEKDWPRIANVVTQVGGSPLHFLDAASDTVGTIRAEIRRLATRNPLGLVIVDYLQIIQPEHARRDNRQVDVAEIARGLKNIAREFNIPVVALAQLSRGVELRSDKRPILADLRESGDIENNSDVVIFIYRDDYYNPESKDAGIAELIVRKQRSGPQGVARVAWHAPYTRFANLAQGATI